MTVAPIVAVDRARATPVAILRRRGYPVVIGDRAIAAITAACASTCSACTATLYRSKLTPHQQEMVKPVLFFEAIRIPLRVDRVHYIGTIGGPLDLEVLASKRCLQTLPWWMEGIEESTPLAVHTMDCELDVG